MNIKLQGHELVMEIEKMHIKLRNQVQVSRKELNFLKEHQVKSSMMILKNSKELQSDQLSAHLNFSIVKALITQRMVIIEDQFTSHRPRINLGMARKLFHKKKTMMMI